MNNFLILQFLGFLVKIRLNIFFLIRYENPEWKRKGADSDELQARERNRIWERRELFAN